MPKQTTRALAPEALDALCLQLHELLRAGVTPEESFALLGEDARDEEERALFSAVSESLSTGDSLGDALEGTDGFPPYLCGMVRVGERTGTLDEVFLALSRHFAREAALAESVRGAVLFPMMMGGVMIVLLAVMVAFVLPVFSRVFASMGMTLSPVADTLMRGAPVILTLAGVLLAGGLAFCVLLLYARRSGKVAFLQKTRLFRQVAGGRFASAMALMLHSGLPLEEAVTRAGALAGDEQSKAAASCAAARIDEGAAFGEALENTGLFSAFHLRLLRVGERTGRTERMMDEVAVRMTQEAGARLDEQIARIEPIVVVVLAAAAGLMLLSVLLPLLGTLAVV